MLNKPDPKQNFYELEAQLLHWWKENNILEKSIEQRSEDKSFTFYDGPITANGEPHTGHMLTFSLKDIIPRYKTMKGYKVSRSLGWDCHGIPVEYQVEKKLGFKEKHDIVKFGIKEFNQLCRESVEKYKSNIIELEEKMGRLTNDEEEYATMDKDFIESVWWSLKTLYEKEMLYEGFKVVPYSTRAGTTLSNAEVALGGYKKIVDPAITVQFELKNEPNTFILAWTTTPWTIPGNLGLAIGKKVKYVKVKKIDDSTNTYILANDLVESVFGKDSYEVVGEILSSDLVGKEYNPPFDFYLGRKNAHKIYFGEHVTTDSGTGIVHLAPYGAEDNDIFQKVGIESFDYLDDQGHFTNEIKPLAGMFYKQANKEIIDNLAKLDKLFNYSDYEHDMPMCWRTDTPLIYKPITSWYVGVSKLREELVENNKQINWIPDHAREGRFGNWLSEIKDWGISRSRYWGTPLPVWKSESGKLKFIGSFEELKELSGVEIEDPHRPFVDDITFELGGEKYTRIPDVIDVWYDSGAMPFARLHYPFENKEKFENKFPAEYIAEGIDQTRGWFYTLHAIATTLFNSYAFKNVIINGTITDDKGHKLSKSLGNYTPPLEMIEKYGADTVRLNFFSSPLMYGEDSAVTDYTLKAVKQETILPLWNIYTYLTTYANIHNWTPRAELAYNDRNVTDDEHPWDHIPFDDVDNNMDAWLLLKLQNTISEVTAALDEYKIPKATASIKNLVTETSKWYIRSSRDRFADGDLRALDTLYYVLIEALKLLAPFTPFISEEIYRALVVNELENQVESIHLTNYPVADKIFIEQYSAIDSEMELVRKMTEFGHNLRVENKLKVRQPLENLYYLNLDSSIPQITDWMKEILKSELNVKNVLESADLSETEFVKLYPTGNDSFKLGLDIQLTDELRLEGALRELTRFVQSERKQIKLNLSDKIKLSVQTESKFLMEMINKFENELKESVNANSVLLEDINEGVEVKIDGENLKFKIAI